MLSEETNSDDAKTTDILNDISISSFIDSDVTFKPCASNQSACAPRITLNINAENFFPNKTRISNLSFIDANSSKQIIDYSGCYFMFCHLLSALVYRWLNTLLWWPIRIIRIFDKK